MNCYYEKPWFRHGLLLLALAAGGLMTFFVPTHQEMAAAREQSAQPASATDSRETASGDVTGVDVDLRHLDSARTFT